MEIKVNFKTLSFTSML